MRPGELNVAQWPVSRDRKSTRLNSSHRWISYAVFCLKHNELLSLGPERVELWIGALIITHGRAHRRAAHPDLFVVFFFLMSGEPAKLHLFPPQPVFAF